MKISLDDLQLFAAVAQAGGFRDAARSGRTSASGMSQAVRRIETDLGVRLLNRTTRSVVLTEAGRDLLNKLQPILRELDTALDVVNGHREQPRGSLKLNVPTSAARLVLPSILPPFLQAFPDITVEVVVDESFVDVLASGCDAGIRYEERLEQDMIAVPIGPRVQRFAAAASPAYLQERGRPTHPRELLDHSCIQGRFASGANFTWEFERNEEVVRIEPAARLVVQVGGATDLAVEAAQAGVGVVILFEDWLRPHFQSGSLEPVLEEWWPSFSGPFLYYPGRRLVPAPLRAFLDFIRNNQALHERPASKLSRQTSDGNR